MISEPKVEDRAEQPYVAIPADVTMQEFDSVGALFREVVEWVTRRGITPAGPPFIRYLTVDMASKLHVEVGMPIDTPISGDRRVTGGWVPAGRYATLVHTGGYQGPKGLEYANAELQRWATEQGLVWQNSGHGSDEVWGGRFEFYLTDPAEHPDPDQWVTEVAYQIKAD